MVLFPCCPIQGRGYVLSESDKFLHPCPSPLVMFRRFHLEVVKAVCDAIGSEKVGLRLSPFNTFLDCIDSTPYETNDYLLQELNKLRLAYVHLVSW